MKQLYYILCLLLRLITETITSELTNCSWETHSSTANKNSTLLCLSKKWNSKNEKFLSSCTRNNHSSTDARTTWNCNVALQDPGPCINSNVHNASILVVYECGTHDVSCPSSSRFMCEDNFCIHSPSSSACLLHFGCFMNSECFECSNHSGCPDSKICRQNRCKDPCDFTECNSNSQCKAEAHVAKCRTVEEAQRNPYCEAKDAFGETWKVRRRARGTKPCPKNGASGNATWSCPMIRNAHRQIPKFRSKLPDYSQCESRWVHGVVMNSSNVTSMSTLDEAIIFIERLANDTTANRGKTTTNKNESSYFGSEIPRILITTVHIVSVVTQQNNATFDKVKPILEDVIRTTDNVMYTATPWNELPQDERSSTFTKVIAALETTTTLVAAKRELNSHVEDGRSRSRVYESPTLQAEIGSVMLNNKSDAITTLKVNTVPLGENGKKTTTVQIELPSSTNGARDEVIIDYSVILQDADSLDNVLPGYNATNHEPGSAENNSSSTEQKSLSEANQMLNGQIAIVTLSRRVKNGTISYVPTGQQDWDDDLLSNATVTVIIPHGRKAWGNHEWPVRGSGGESDTSVKTGVLGSATCVSWSDDEKNWTTHNCFHVKSTDEATECQCKLTSRSEGRLKRSRAIAVLMNAHKYLEPNIVLDYMTIVFCSLSVVALSLVVIAYSIVDFKRMGRKMIHQKIIKHLCINLMFGNLFLVLVLDKNFFGLGNVACEISGVLGHFFFIASFAWMAIEGINLYKSTLVFETHCDFLNMKFYYATAYLSPFIVVAVTYAVGCFVGPDAYANDAICWLNDVYLWSFNGPVALVVPCNIICLTKTLWVTYRRGKKKIGATPIIPKKKNRKWIWGGLCLTNILGVTWVFGFMVQFDDTLGLVAAYVFTVLSAAQGVFIFVFYVAMEEKVRMALLSRFGYTRKTKVPETKSMFSLGSSHP